MRDLLIRAQRDTAFAELARTDPEAAAAEYDLSADEMKSLRRLGWDLYRYLVPTFGNGDMSLTLPPTTLTEPLHLTYHSFSDLARGPKGPEVEERRRELVEVIAGLRGAERRARIQELMEYM